MNEFNKLVARALKELKNRAAFYNIDLSQINNTGVEYPLIETQLPLKPKLLLAYHNFNYIVDAHEKGRADELLRIFHEMFEATDFNKPNDWKSIITSVAMMQIFFNDGKSVLIPIPYAKIDKEITLSATNLDTTFNDELLLNLALTTCYLCYAYEGNVISEFLHQIKMYVNHVYKYINSEPYWIFID